MRVNHAQYYPQNKCYPYWMKMQQFIEIRKTLIKSKKFAKIELLILECTSNLSHKTQKSFALLNYFLDSKYTPSDISISFKTRAKGAF